MIGIPRVNLEHLCNDCFKSTESCAHQYGTPEARAYQKKRRKADFMQGAMSRNEVLAIIRMLHGEKKANQVFHAWGMDE